MGKIARLALVTGCLVTMLSGPAQASTGICASLGDVCYKVLYRPMDQICRIYEVCL